MPLYVMQQELKLFDRNIDLVPLAAGFRLPGYVHESLAPFSTRPVVPFDEVGSRRRALDPTAPRCFDTVVLCRLKNMYDGRPGPKYKVDNTSWPYVGGDGLTHEGDKAWRWWRGGAAGQYVSCFPLFACVVGSAAASGMQPPPANGMQPPPVKNPEFVLQWKLT